MSEHVGERPSWDCRSCGRPWPCDPAREALAAELGPIQLAMYAWANLEQAAGDLPGMPVGEMFDRFLAWTRATPAARSMPDAGHPVARRVSTRS
jgi:hypothetical protein